MSSSNGLKELDTQVRPGHTSRTHVEAVDTFSRPIRMHTQENDENDSCTHLPKLQERVRQLCSVLPPWQVWSCVRWHSVVSETRTRVERQKSSETDSRRPRLETMTREKRFFL